MASDVEIVNNALALLGDNVITSLADDTVRARLANLIYGPTRDAVLRSHPWNCAVTRASLALLAEAPAFGWAHQYELPTDPYCLRVLSVNESEQYGTSGDTFKVERRVLLTDAGTANIRYIARIEDPNEYDVLLYEAFSARLAVKMAYPITGSLTMLKGMTELYVSLLQQARTVDGQEGSPDRREITSLLDVR